MSSHLGYQDFENILSSSPNAIIATDAVDPARPILFANPAFETLTGFLRDEVLGRGTSFLLAQTDAEENARALEVLRAAVADARRATIVLRARRRDGSVFWNEVSVYPVVNQHTGRRLAVKSQRDVTQRVEDEASLRRTAQAHLARAASKSADVRKALEQLYDERIERRRVEGALRATERRYQSIFEHAIEGIYRSTPEGRYVDANPALASMYGFASPAEMLAAVDSIEKDIYVDPAMREAFRTRIERDGLVRNLEYEVRRRDGSRIWISENARAIRGPSGRIVAYEGTIQDVTDRRAAQAAAQHLERQLLQAQKMEAIGTLAGGVAHDFNNILGTIVGFAEMAQEDLPGDSIAANNLQQIVDAARRGKDIVRQILTFSRAGSSQRTTIRLGPVIREAVRFLTVTLPPRVEIVEDLATDGDPVIADATQIQQVLLNLGTNAAHAMRSGGGTLTIRLRSHVIEAGTDELPAGRYVAIHVSDTGHGMTAEVMRRIFEPFFTTKPVGEGSGLGLSVAHGIVRDHGGALRVTSEPQRGSVFTVLLPATPPSGSPPAGSDHSTSA